MIDKSGGAALTVLAALAGCVVGAAVVGFVMTRTVNFYDTTLRTQTAYELGRQVKMLEQLEAGTTEPVKEALLQSVTIATVNLIAQGFDTLDPGTQSQIRAARQYFSTHPPGDPALQTALDQIP